MVVGVSDTPIYINVLVRQYKGVFLFKHLKCVNNAYANDYR